MEDDKYKKIVEAAKLYYLHDYSQQEIASQLHISRPTVSRLLQQAKEEGIVQIQIIDRCEDSKQLEFDLQHKFGLQTAIVAPGLLHDEHLIMQHLGKLGAEYLHQTIKDGDIIGITWGRTLYQVASSLKKKTMVKNVQLVQLNGGVSHSEQQTYDSETLHLFGQAFNAASYHLPLPAIVDHVVVKQAIEADRHIRKLLDMGKQANIAVFTVGVPLIGNLLFQVGYLAEQEMEIISEQATGDIAARFFNVEGRICHEPLNARTIGIELEELKHKEKSILIAGGASKVDGIKGALHAKYANVLITDQLTAQMLLQPV
ncbi:sugar-binding transcriptional regulator [Paenibacillus sp. 481]|uniref:sugar-binding transcriptional regulator n=1 Tax=Paenibacillus sp. 481 TaxID=2835869 RepID=UPI001E3A8900|nr:sugar-binding transcriptional regulator [Paenibacillus sp. 481]UHA74951.1 sugar-binding transcriptional regulator [Paenibacillus sp. 481]